MSINKGKQVDKIETRRDLLIKKEYLNKDTPEYKEFNDAYELFCDLNDKEINEEDALIFVENAKKAAFLIAYKFDFNKEELKDKKSDYIKIAREILYLISSKPYNDSEGLIYLIRAMYGQTNIAYSHNGEHKIVNIQDGNEWVDYLEKNTRNGVLKAYALTLRAFQYIVNGELLGMSVKDRINKSEKDLIYATKWDENNYYAYYALGLIYLDEGNSKYNKEKALDNFKKVVSYENEFTILDNYLTNEEKQRAINNAKKKIEYLNNK